MGEVSLITRAPGSGPEAASDQEIASQAFLGIDLGEQESRPPTPTARGDLGNQARAHPSPTSRTSDVDPDPPAEPAAVMHQVVRQGAQVAER
jgi:hypothetical protein